MRESVSADNDLLPGPTRNPPSARRWIFPLLTRRSLFTAASTAPSLPPTCPTTCAASSIPQTPTSGPANPHLRTRSGQPTPRIILEEEEEDTAAAGMVPVAGVGGAGWYRTSSCEAARTRNVGGVEAEEARVGRGGPRAGRRCSLGGTWGPGGEDFFGGCCLVEVEVLPTPASVAVVNSNEGSSTFGVNSPSSSSSTTLAGSFSSFCSVLLAPTSSSFFDGGSGAAAHSRSLPSHATSMTSLPAATAHWSLTIQSALVRPPPAAPDPPLLFERISQSARVPP